MADVTGSLLAGACCFCGTLVDRGAVGICDACIAKAHGRRPPPSVPKVGDRVLYRGKRVTVEEIGWECDLSANPESPLPSGPMAVIRGRNFVCVAAYGDLKAVPHG